MTKTAPAPWNSKHLDCAVADSLCSLGCKLGCPYGNDSLLHKLWRLKQCSTLSSVLHHNVMLSELLRHRGLHSYMSGLWERALQQSPLSCGPQPAAGHTSSLHKMRQVTLTVSGSMTGVSVGGALGLGSA